MVGTRLPWVGLDTQSVVAEQAFFSHNQILLPKVGAIRLRSITVVARRRPVCKKSICARRVRLTRALDVYERYGFNAQRRGFYVTEVKFYFRGVGERQKRSCLTL